MSLEQTLKAHIREVPDFPKKGILFKDISPIFLQPELLKEMVPALKEPWKDKQVTKVIGIDSRGFLMGPQLAMALGAGFVLVRKKGKLPPETISISYELEYGKAVLESTTQAISKGDRVVIHDDLLATGGTAFAAAKLVQKLEAEVLGFSFLIHLNFLNGSDRLKTIHPQIHALVSYDS